MAHLLVFLLEMTMSEINDTRESDREVIPDVIGHPLWPYVFTAEIVPCDEP